jgi:hypothetical protein
MLHDLPSVVKILLALRKPMAPLSDYKEVLFTSTNPCISYEVYLCMNFTDHPVECFI